MILQFDNYVIDADVEATKAYSLEHALCELGEDRNFCVQARERLQKLTQFLEQFGLMIERPDEIGSRARENDIDYYFVGYTAVGNVLKASGYEIDLFDGGLFLNIVINGRDVPNGQKTTNYFTVTVYNIRLPWVLDEPFPQSVTPRPSLLSNFKEIFRRK